MIAASNPTPRSDFTGGTSAYLVTDSGVVVVDTKLAGYGPDHRSDQGGRPSKPITTIINTHTHGDHTGSNDGFPASVEIIAHENTKANMMRMDAFKGDKAQFLPKKTYTDKTVARHRQESGRSLLLRRAATRAATRSSSIPALRVLQTGDMFAWKDAPPLYDRSQRRQRRRASQDDGQAAGRGQGRGCRHPRP